MKKILAKLNPVSWVKDWVITKYLTGFISGLVKQWGLDGKKTETGVVVTLLGFLMLQFPELHPFIDPVYQELVPYAVEVTLLGFVELLWGYGHSLIKKIKPKEKDDVAG